MAIKSNSRDGQINGNIQIYLKTSSLEREREREQNTPKESDYIGNSAIHTAKSIGASKMMHSDQI